MSISSKQEIIKLVIGVGNKLRLLTVRNDLLPNHEKFQKFKIRNFNSKELEKDFVARSRAHGIFA